MVRNYSNFLFDSSTIDYNDNYLDQQSKDKGRDYLINNVSSNYQLTRQYAKQSDMRFNTKESYVDATLLEYGFNFRAHIAFGTDDVGEAKGGADEAYPDREEGKTGKNKLSAKYGDIMTKIGGGAKQNVASKSKDDENIETAEEEEKRLESLRVKMESQQVRRDKNVSGSALVGIIDRDAVESGKGSYNEEEMAKQALELKINDKEFVYNERKKNLEVRYKELSAAKKLKIRSFKVENEKMETLDEQI
eukprot:UN11455